MPKYEWDRQPGESDRAFAIFTAWRKRTPPRPQWKELAEEYRMSATQVRNWASRRDWKGRAAAWDAVDHDSLTLEDQFNRKVSDMATPEALEPAANALAAARIARTQLVSEMATKALEGVRLLDPHAMKPSDIIALARVVVGLDQAALTINVGDAAVTIDRAALDNMDLEQAQKIIDGTWSDGAP